MSTFVKGTRLHKEDIEAARSMNTRDVISARTGWTFERAGSEWHCKEHDSLVVFRDEKGWKWYSRGLKGASALDFLINAENIEFQEAVAQLSGKSYVSYRQEQTSAPKQEQPRELVLPPSARKPNGEQNFNNVFAYLNKTRGIERGVIEWCIKQKILYQDEHNNCVFIGKNAAGEPKFACKRGTYSMGDKPAYKRDCLGSSKSYGFNMQGSVETHIFVFEAAIDAMSHASLSVLKAQGAGRTDYENLWKRHTRLALGGVSDAALYRYLAEHPKVTEISFCLDNDDAGRTAAAELSKKYSEKGYKTHIYTLPEKYGKDYNEFLLAFRKQLETGNNISLSAGNRPTVGQYQNGGSRNTYPPPYQSQFKTKR